MTRAEAISVLSLHSDQIRGLGATSLFMFGSAARDDMTEGSDVDLFIDFDPPSDFSFVELVRLKSLMEESLNRDVDLTTRAGLHPRLKAEIERSSIRIF